MSEEGCNDHKSADYPPLDHGEKRCRLEDGESE